MTFLNRITRYILALLVVVSVFSVPRVLAAVTDPSQDVTPTSGEVKTDLRTAIEAEDANFNNPEIGDFLTATINFAIIIGALLCLMYLIWGGIDWVTSGGDQQKYSSARNKITAAIIGLAILTCAYAIWLIIVKFLGLETLFDTTGTA